MGLRARDFPTERVLSRLPDPLIIRIVDQKHHIPHAQALILVVVTDSGAGGAFSSPPPRTPWAVEAEEAPAARTLSPPAPTTLGAETNLRFDVLPLPSLLLLFSTTVTGLR